MGGPMVILMVAMATHMVVMATHMVIMATHMGTATMAIPIMAMHIMVIPMVGVHHHRSCKEFIYIS